MIKTDTACIIDNIIQTPIYILHFSGNNYETLNYYKIIDNTLKQNGYLKLLFYRKENMNNGEYEIYNDINSIDLIN